MEYVIVNGEFILRQDAKVDIEDRGYQFGDGVYEVVRVYNGKMFTGQEHVQRLEESADKIGMKLTYSRAEIEDLLNQLIVKNKLELGIVYLQFTRGISTRNHLFPTSDTPQTFVAYTRAVDRPVSTMTEGVKTILNEDIRWLRCDIKSLNLLGNLLAKQKAADAGCFEAIQHRGNRVTEGSLSNISIVIDGVVYTHPADHYILNGITRQKMLQLCQENGIPAEERTFTVEDLLGADEVFLTGTTVEVTPIIEIEGKAVANGHPGEITKKLQFLFQDAIEQECGKL